MHENTWMMHENTWMMHENTWMMHENTWMMHENLDDAREHLDDAWESGCCGGFAFTLDVKYGRFVACCYDAANRLLDTVGMLFELHWGNTGGPKLFMKFLARLLAICSCLMPSVSQLIFLISLQTIRVK